MNNILEVRGLNKRYDQFALKNVAFNEPEGYIMGFVGPNGAGKTTTIKSILNMVGYESGEIRVLGMDAKADAMAINERIGVVMDTPFYVNEWRVRDVERALSPFYQSWSAEKFASMLKQFRLDPMKRVKELSRGMKLKLMLAAAFSHDARLLILDEPTSGLDPVARDELADILREFMLDETKGVLFSTHITSDLDKLADYITFIRDGEIVYTGLKDSLMEGFALVKGGPSDISLAQKRLIIGIREHSAGFEGMIRTEDTDKLPGTLSFEPVTLDEIIVFMNKEMLYE